MSIGSVFYFFTTFAAYNDFDPAPVFVGIFVFWIMFILIVAYGSDSSDKSDSKEKITKKINEEKESILDEQEDDLIDTDDPKDEKNIESRQIENENEEVIRDEIVEDEEDGEADDESVEENEVEEEDIDAEEDMEDEEDDFEDEEDEREVVQPVVVRKKDDKDFGGIKLGPEQSRVFETMNSTNDNLFITGKAGTGKSVLLQYFVQHTSKQIAVVAPTGVAALNVGGQTIHSFFAMSLDIQDSDDPSKVRKMDQKRKETLKNLQTLVIDEVSMVRVDIMDMIDAKLKYARNNNKPFGGCQIIAFGDLFQLPPVVGDSEASRYLEDKYSTVFFFGAEEINKHPFKIIELQHVFRQKDSTFINILNNVRLGKVDAEMLSMINEKCATDPKNDDYITLTGSNQTAKAINNDRLKALKHKEYIYHGTTTGSFIEKNMPTDSTLHLKVGAHVMMVKNDRTESYGVKLRSRPRWVNGTLGVVSALTQNTIKVRINGIEHSIDKETWEQYEYSYDEEKKVLEKEVTGTFTQFPVRLAYAITIHKSQGQTYDAVNINLSKGAFDSGQAYVALSRCRSMNTLYLTKPLKMSDIRVSQEVLEYMKDKTVEPSERTDIYKIIDVRQRSDNWQKMRHGKVTGTTAYYLKYNSVSYAIRKGIEDEDRTYVSEAMERGRELEPIGIAKFAKEKKVKVEQAGFVESLIHKDAGFSPDGVIFGDDGKIRTIIEHKAFGPKHHLSCYEHIDDKVMYQIQFGMFVTGAKDAYLVLYNPDITVVKSRLLIKRVIKDSKIQELFRERFAEYESGKTSLTSTSTRVWRSTGTARPVLKCDDSGRVLAEYSSASEAASIIGIDPKGIWDVAHGKQKHAGGYVWKYKD